MNVLLVHSHPEPQSFSSGLARTARETLEAAGHSVTVSDLYADGFDPVSGRNNFTTVKDPEYFKQQQEELFATAENGFEPALEAEIQKLEQADLLIFSFPIWWFGLPAMLKGWVDRAFPMGRVYGGGRIYETGLGAARQARAMILMTTGGGAQSFGGRGVNPSMDTILAPIQHGVFWFNGFQPLEPFIAWGVARASDADRAGYLEQLRKRLTRVFEEPPIQLPPLADFPRFGTDQKKRYVVVVTRNAPLDEAMRALVPAEVAHLAELKKSGYLVSQALGPATAQPWRGFLTFRAESVDEVQAQLATLPLPAWLEFEIHETT
jgi:NAD(P)H dehydrogenase (quinone)